MADPFNDDLFEGTSMSFGEHLEELRVVLIRSLMGLMIGVGLGLLLANHVVGLIQSPLKGALERFYAAKAKIELDEEYGKLLSLEVADFIIDNQLEYEEVLLEVSEFERIKKQLESLEPLRILTEAELKEESGKKELTEEEEEKLQQRIKENQEKIASAIKTAVESKLPVPDVNLVKTRFWKKAESKIISLGAQEAFMIWLKAGFVAGFIFSSPWIFLQVWNFVGAGLYPHEKRYVHLYLPFSLGLFLAGASLAFFFVFEPVLDFLFSFNLKLDITTEPRISEWISFVLFLPLGFGVAFQLPLVMLFMNRIGIFDISVYLEKWRIAILVIFVISMLLTPADPISMLLMACPLTVLYFLGIVLCKWMPKGRNPFSEAYEP